jgi:hypothetical protein
MNMNGPKLSTSMTFLLFHKHALQLVCSKGSQGRRKIMEKLKYFTIGKKKGYLPKEIL